MCVCVCVCVKMIPTLPLPRRKKENFRGWIREYMACETKNKYYSALKELYQPKWDAPGTIKLAE